MKHIFSVILLMWFAVVIIISFFYPQTSDVFLANQQIVNFLVYGILSLFIISRIQIEKRFSPHIVISITVCLVTVISGTIEIIREFYFQQDGLNVMGFIVRTLSALIISYVYRKWVWFQMSQLFSISFKG